MINPQMTNELTSPGRARELPLSLVSARATWSIEEEGFPFAGSPAAQLLFLLKYAVLAPSLCNSQPWRFQVGADCIDVLADRSRALKALDPHGRELTMACGAALQNLVTAAHYFGYNTEVDAFPDAGKTDRIARVRLGRGRVPTVEDRDLFRAITLTRTVEGPFDAARPSAHLVNALRRLASRDGCALSIVDCPVVRAHLERLIVDADHWQRGQERLVAERKAWARDPRSEFVDGVASETPMCPKRTPDLGAPVWSMDVCSSASAENHVRHLLELVHFAPVLVVLGTRRDTPRDWLAAGRAAQHLALAARHAGVWLSPFEQPVQVPAARHQLRRLVEVRGWPQRVARLGFGPELKPTPRRSAQAAVLAS
jgi:hypothetical protein